MASRFQRKVLPLIPLYILLIAIALLIIYPCVWMVLTPFKTSSEVWSTSLRSLIPRQFSWDLYEKVLEVATIPIWVYIKNSLVTSLGSVAINVTACILAAYALARRRLIGENLFILFFTAMMIIPQQVIAVPLYLVLNDMKLLDTYSGVILSLSAEGLSIVVLYRFFREIPQELIDAAKVDGATEFDVVTRIVIPLSWPAVTTVILLQFIASWNAFIIPLVSTISQEKYTLQVVMAYFSTSLYVKFRLIMAVGTIITIPSILIYVLTQRKIIEGMTAGALKE